MKKSGFTVIEMMVTISILAIVLSIAAPSFRDTMSSSNMVSNANGMIGAFNYARSEAINRGSAVNITKVGASWTEGFSVWVDANDDGFMAASDVLRVWPAFNNGSTVTTDNVNDDFTFNAMGEVDFANELTICDDRSGEQGMEITILLSGIVFAEKVTCG